MKVTPQTITTTVRTGVLIELTETERLELIRTLEWVQTAHNPNFPDTTVSNCGYGVTIQSFINSITAAPEDKQ